MILSHSLYKNIYFPATVVALAGIICVYLVSSQTIFPSFTAIVPFPWWCLRKRLCSFYHITKHHKIVTVIWWETMTKIQPFSGFLHKTHIIRIVFCRVSTDVNAVPLQHAHTHTDTHIGAYFEQFFRRPKEFLGPFIRLSFIHLLIRCAIVCVYIRPSITHLKYKNCNILVHTHAHTFPLVHIRNAIC